MFSVFRPKAAFIHPRMADALGGSFSEHELRWLSRLGTVVELDTGAVLATEGSFGCEAVVILDGSAAVSRGDEVVATVGVGSILGEMALINDEPRNASLVATTPLTCVVMNRSEFLSLLRQCPRLDQVVRDLAEERASAN